MTIYQGHSAAAGTYRARDDEVGLWIEIDAENVVSVALEGLERPALCGHGVSWSLKQQ